MRSGANRGLIGPLLFSDVAATRLFGWYPTQENGHDCGVILIVAFARRLMGQVSCVAVCCASKDATPHQEQSTYTYSHIVVLGKEHVAPAIRQRHRSCST